MLATSWPLEARYRVAFDRPDATAVAAELRQLIPHRRAPTKLDPFTTVAHERMEPRSTVLADNRISKASMLGSENRRLAGVMLSRRAMP